MLTTTKKGVTLIRYNIQLHLLFDDWLITSIFFFPPQLWRLGCMFPGPTQQIVFFSLKFMHIKMPIKYWPHDLRKWITCTNSFPSPWFPFHFKCVTWPWFWVGVDFNMLAWWTEKLNETVRLNNLFSESWDNGAYTCPKKQRIS